MNPAVYAFDVDETLEVSGGPVRIQDLIELRNQGHIVGLCGNWAMVTRHVPFWPMFISFLGQMAMEKSEFLIQLKTHIPCAEVVMVGNELGVTGASDDQGAAKTAGVRFIREDAFAAGAR